MNAAVLHNHQVIGKTRRRVFAISRPSIFTAPPLSGSSLAMAENRVDLPQPLGPISAVISPVGTDRMMS